MFAQRLRALRWGQQLTLRQLAEALSENLTPDEHAFTPSQIGNWERGERTPKVSEIRHVAEYFGVSMDYLCGRSDRDGQDLANLLIANQALSFNQTPLTANDCQNIYQLINGYLVGKQNHDQPTPEELATLKQLNLKL